jgi:uncharacterized membrane protein
MVDERIALAAIVGMALVTYATRAGGVFLMGLVPITPRLESFLRSLSSSVLVALIVPAALKGDAASSAAVASAGLVMIATRSAIGAMIAGVAVAALWRLVQHS